MLKIQPIRKFDLNIEEILENWEVYHGIREIIANALDEQTLTTTKDIEIFEDISNNWHIRDYGRGLKYEHLTQKENQEKVNHPNLIGKFGIGLKDALATFDRNGVEVAINSKHGFFTIEKSKKYGFADIITLHAVVTDPVNPNFIGTEVVLKKVSKNDIEKAKALFLKFSGDILVESTDFGDIYKQNSNSATIYINGVKVAEEANFLFSYNITSLTRQIKKALNRERSNVGRNAYRDRIKKILLACESEEVALGLIDDLQKMEQGTSHDEILWLDIQQHAVNILSTKKEALFVTPSELQDSFYVIDEAQSRGLEIITITETLREKIRNTSDISGNPIRDIDYFNQEIVQSFEFKFIKPKYLEISERRIFNLKDKIFEIIGGKPHKILKVKISETMRKDPMTFREVSGLWEESTGSIIIKRDQLTHIRDFCGTMLHEIAHCISGSEDVSRTFELELTRLLGLLCSKIVNDQ